MVALNEKELFEQIGRQVGGFYAVCSPDGFLRERAVKKIVGAVPPPRDILRLDAQTLDISSLEDGFSNIASFNDEAKIYIFNGDTLDELSAERAERLAVLASDIPSNSFFIVWCSTDRRHPSLPKSVEKLCIAAGGAAAVLPQKTGAELVSEIEVLAAENGAAIERAAAERLIDMCGGELALIRGEVSKAAAYSGYRTIKAADIDRLTVRTVDSGVFDIIRAAGAGNTRAALGILGELLRNHEEPIAIAAALNTNYINYYRALLLKKSGRPLSDMYELYGYKKSDIKPKIAYEKCGSYTIARLERIINILYRFDSDVKSLRVDPAIQLEAALAGILTA